MKSIKICMLPIAVWMIMDFSFYKNMRNLFLLALSLVLFGNCSLFSYDKEELDIAVARWWNEWKATHPNDSVYCVVDFAQIVPFVWDTLVYVDYRVKEQNSIEAKRYGASYNPDTNFGLTEVHFLNKGKVVAVIEQLLASDSENGTLFCTNCDFIKRGRDEAKFHLLWVEPYFLVKNISEHNFPLWRYVDTSVLVENRLYKTISEYWNEWGTSNDADSTYCVVDFADIVPFEWDEMVYADYNPTLECSDELMAYLSEYPVKPKHLGRYCVKDLCFYSKGKVVAVVDNLLMDYSDKGISFDFSKDFVKYSRDNAKFRITQKGSFFLVNDVAP